MEKELNTKQTKELFEIISKLETPKEAQKFLRDLCTLSEILAMSERWQDAKLVDDGIPYRKIAEANNSSTATVTRVAHWLKHGKGGYRMMLDRVKK